MAKATKESTVRFVATRLWQVGVAANVISATTPIWGALSQGKAIMQKAKEAGVSESNPEYQRLLRQVRPIDSAFIAAVQFVYSPELTAALATWKQLDSRRASNPPSLIDALDRLYFNEEASFDEFYEELENLLTLVDRRLRGHPTWMVPNNARAHLEALQRVQNLANELWVIGAIGEAE